MSVLVVPLGWLAEGWNLISANTYWFSEYVSVEIFWNYYSQHLSQTKRNHKEGRSRWCRYLQWAHQQYKGSPPQKNEFRTVVGSRRKTYNRSSRSHFSYTTYSTFGTDSVVHHYCVIILFYVHYCVFFVTKSLATKRLYRDIFEPHVTSSRNVWCFSHLKLCIL